MYVFPAYLCSIHSVLFFYFAIKHSSPKWDKPLKRHLDSVVSRHCVEQAGRISHADNFDGLSCCKVSSHVEEMKLICVKPEK